MRLFPWWWCWDWRLMRRNLRFVYQVIMRGWCDAETWNLNNELAKFLLPRLKRYRQISCGYPPNLTQDQWDTIIDCIIRGLESGIKDGCTNDDFYKEKYGYRLLGKYLMTLWW